MCRFWCGTVESSQKYVSSKSRVRLKVFIEIGNPLFKNLEKCLWSIFQSVTSALTAGWNVFEAAEC